MVALTVGYVMEKTVKGKIIIYNAEGITNIKARIRQQEGEGHFAKEK